MLVFQSYYGKLKFPARDPVLGCHFHGCKVSILISEFPKNIRLKSPSELFEANWSTTLLLAIRFFLARGEKRTFQEMSKIFQILCLELQMFFVAEGDLNCC